MTGPQDGHVHPTRDDPVVAALSEGVGGPVGTRASRHPWWTPTRVVLLVAAAVFALGMVQKSGCYERQWIYDDHRYTHMCYSDLPYLYTGRGLVELEWPYSDDAQVRSRYEVMEYPVGISYFAYAAAWVTHWAAGAPDVGPRSDVPAADLVGTDQVLKETRGFVIVNALFFALLALLSAWLLAGVHRRRPWDAMAFAASPALLLTGIINWDMLAVVLVAGALWTWSRDRPVATGVLIGLGTATKLYPLFLLGPIAVICLRQRRYRELAETVLAAAAVWLLTNAPAYSTGSDEWKRFWEFNSERGPDLGSIWLLLTQALDTPISAATVNHWSWAFFALWCAGSRCSASGRRSPRGWPSSASSWWSASCWSTRSTRRSTSSGCCRSRRWPGRGGATSWSSRAARSSTSRRCGGTSRPTSTPAAAPARWRTGPRS